MQPLLTMTGQHPPPQRVWLSADCTHLHGQRLLGDDGDDAALAQALPAAEAHRQAAHVQHAADGDNLEHLLASGVKVWLLGTLARFDRSRGCTAKTGCSTREAEAGGKQHLSRQKDQVCERCLLHDIQTRW